MEKTKGVVIQVREELVRHLPFTVVGAVTGVVLFIAFRGIAKDISYRVFYVLHPLHVLFSTLVTASLYERHRHLRGGGRASFLSLLVIGYVGGIGIATLSDSLIPFLGETLLNLPERAVHIGFIEKWWLVNPLAVSGVALAYFRPRTRIPHAGHVLLSTYASLFHVIMALGAQASAGTYAGILLFLIAAVWVPCCLSDIVFPVAAGETGK